jgi:hypothetical protein
MMNPSICSIKKKKHRIGHEWIDHPLTIPSSPRRREHDEHGPTASHGESSSSPQFMATITWYQKKTEKNDVPTHPYEQNMPISWASNGYNMYKSKRGHQYTQKILHSVARNHPFG